MIDTTGINCTEITINSYPVHDWSAAKCRLFVYVVLRDLCSLSHEEARTKASECGGIDGGLLINRPLSTGRYFFGKHGDALYWHISMQADKSVPVLGGRGPGRRIEKANGEEVLGEKVMPVKQNLQKQVEKPNGSRNREQVLEEKVKALEQRERNRQTQVEKSNQKIQDRPKGAGAKLRSWGNRLLGRGKKVREESPPSYEE